MYGVLILLAGALTGVAYCCKRKWGYIVVLRGVACGSAALNVLNICMNT